MNIYGYCRVSTPTQNIDRQERNILKSYPTAKIYKEAYTGTKIDGRAVFSRLTKILVKGDTLVFDSVSRMSRNAEDGIQLYFDFYKRGIELVFLKEPYINTATYKKATEQKLDKTGNTIADIYIEATNKVFQVLAAEQIKLAFEQAEKEVQDLHQRTSEGMKTAKLNGKRIGRQSGSTVITQRSQAAKKMILERSRTFGGSLTDKEMIAIFASGQLTYKYKTPKKTIDKPLKISRSTFYDYKKELVENYNQQR